MDEIFQRLNDMRRTVGYLKNIKKEDLDVEEKLLLSRYHIQMMLEAMFAVGNQVISNKVFRKPATYRDVLTILCENKVIEKNLYDNVIDLADLRNRIVHTYWKISAEGIMEIIKNKLVYCEKFVEAIAAYTPP